MKAFIKKRKQQMGMLLADPTPQNDLEAKIAA
jgi:hypothetical protein